MNAWASARGMFARSDSPKSREAVGDPEVDHLGHRSLAEGDLGRVLVEDERRRLAVEVGVAGEGVAQVLVARDVGQDPQLDLAVVGGHEREVRGAGHERAPDPPAERRADRDVLEVRVGRRQPAGRRDGLVERRVEPAVGGHQGRQRVDVGRPQLRVDPPLEQLVDHRMGGAQVLQHRGVGRVARLGALALGQVELEEQDLLELLGAAEVELVPDVLVDLRLEPRDLRRELAREDVQRLEVERDAGRLHPGQDADQRQLQLAVQPVEAVIHEASLQRLAHGDGRQGLQTGARRVVQLRDRGQDEVELLGHHVGDGLAAQRGVEDVRGDLGVERHGCRGGVLVVGDPGHDEGLDLVTDDRRREPIEEPAQRRGVVRTLDRDRPPVRAGDGERQRRSAPGPRVVQQEADPDRGLRGEPGLQGGDGVTRMDLDARRVGDGRGQRRRQVAGDDVRRRGRGGRDDRGPVAVGRRARDRVEVERQLQPAAFRRWTHGSGVAPARRPGGTGHARRGHGSIRGDAAQGLGGVARGLAGHRRQPLDQGAELVLAEETDDGLAVVVAEAGGLEVEVDRQVADDRREVLAHEHGIAVLDELVAQLVRLDLVDPLVQRLERPELADELGRGLLADPGHARDVVGRIALERLVVDHLGGHEVEPLGDLRGVVQDRVLDPRPGRHQPGVVGHQLEHVQVAGHDGGVEAAPLGVHGDRADDVVGLVAGQLVDGDAQRLDDLADLRELVAEVVRHPLAGGLVLGVLLVPEGRPLEVERDRDVVRLDVRDPAQDDAAEAEDRVDELALRRRQGREGEVAAVDEPVAVEQHQAFGGHEPSVPAGLRMTTRGEGLRSPGNVPGTRPDQRSPARLATRRIPNSTSPTASRTAETSDSDGPLEVDDSAPSRFAP